MNGTLGGFLKKPVGWLFMALGLLVIAMTAFVVFQPVKVIPRRAYGPEYRLVDQASRIITQETLAGKIVLFGFGYTSDPTDAIDQTLEDMQGLHAATEAEGPDQDVLLALILYDDQRDTVEKRLAFAAEHDLGGDRWLLLGGDSQTLKRVIGQGFGVYYEAVALEDLIVSQPELASVLDASADPEGYGYLQAQRYILVDERNIIRAEYRAPLDLGTALRDVQLVLRERQSTGASRALNEAAHLFMCYPK